LIKELRSVTIFEQWIRLFSCDGNRQADTRAEDSRLADSQRPMVECSQQSAVNRRLSRVSTALVKMVSRITSVVRQVKPILSVNRENARRKVLILYKAWIRQVPISSTWLSQSYVTNYKLFRYIDRFMLTSLMSVVCLRLIFDKQQGWNDF